MGVTKVDQKNSFIAGPKIQARRYFLTNQIRIFTYLFYSLNIFCWLVSDQDFLECSYSMFLADWLKNVKM